MFLEPAIEAIEAIDVADAQTNVTPFIESLDALTMQVVALSRHDKQRSAHAPTRPGRLLTRLFGIEAAAPLADRRLETVRRFYILTRHRDCLVPALRAELLNVGYTPTQIAMIEGCLYR